MRKFEAAVQSETAPNTNCLWIKDGKLLYFEGGWKHLTGGAIIENKPGNNQGSNSNNSTDTLSDICFDAGVVELTIDDVYSSNEEIIIFKLYSDYSDSEEYIKVPKAKELLDKVVIDSVSYIKVRGKMEELGIDNTFVFTRLTELGVPNDQQGVELIAQIFGGPSILFLGSLVIDLYVEVFQMSQEDLAGRHVAFIAHINPSNYNNISTTNLLENGEGKENIMQLKRARQESPLVKALSR